MQDMPVNTDAKDEKASVSPSGRWILALLFLFFAVPLLLVVLMHHYDWHPKGSSYGELINPARQVKMPAGLFSANGKPINSGIWHDKWSMVYVAETCESACQQRLHSMRQLHVSFAKDIERIQRVLIVSEPAISSLQQQYPDLVIINQPNSELPGLTQQFNVAGGAATKGNRLYLVDPLGNLMMSFPDTVTDADVRKDISKLLRYSWAG